MITNIDFAILNFIHENLSCSLLDAIMPIITSLGGIGCVWIIAGVILICIKKYRVHGIMLLIALLIGVLVGNVILKPLVARPRPCWMNDSFPMIIPIPHDFSFPSGHTLASFIGAVSLFFANKKFAFFAIPLALLIAFSRLYLYVHFPSDVLIGALIGIIIASLIFIIYKKFIQKKLTLKI